MATSSGSRRTRSCPVRRSTRATCSTSTALPPTHRRLEDREEWLVMRRLIICAVVFLAVSAVTRAVFHGMFDALGIDYEPTGGSRSDPKNPPGQVIASFWSLAMPALACVLLYRRREPDVPQSIPTSWAPSSTPLANWYPDPSGQYESRYWDGARWTEHV